MGAPARVSARDEQNRRDRAMHDLRSFYLDDGGSSLFETWEQEGARGDSTTPSISSASYRATIIGVLEAALSRAGGKRLLSLGCGNSVVERDLLSRRCEILAVDALEPAVQLARTKGVPAVQGDVRTWEPAVAGWDVIYADGLMGHLYDESRGFGGLLERFRGWLKLSRASLVISNDVPQTQRDAQPAPGVDGFYWLSSRALVRALERAGFTAITRMEVTYERPLSGPRHRAIITGRT